MPGKFPRARLELAKLAVRGLEDKASSVRKNCTALLTKMILTHPYGKMHGGDLSGEEWKKRYETILKELEPLDQAVEAAAGLLLIH